MIRKTLLISLFLHLIPGFLNAESPAFDAANCGLLKDRIAGSFIGAAIGDALGRVTEFIFSVDAIKQKFGPEGVTHFDNSMQIRLPGAIDPIVPYTDDTVMSLIVAKKMLEGREEKSPVDVIMHKLGLGFAQLFGKNRYLIDPLYNIRAHGNMNVSTCSRLENYIACGFAAKNPQWWYRNADKYENQYFEPISKEAGCGSVMRSWPIGIIFADDLSLVKELADKQSCLTHRHPMARAASVAMAVGVRAAFLQKSPDEVAQEMIEAAQQYEEQELLYKKNVKKIDLETCLESSMVSNDSLLTSDMLRYAVIMAKENKSPEEILGTNNEVQQNYRSKEGFLLGWAADEAAAAALYIFMRHSDDLQGALLEGANTPGDSDSIASLAGALVGARTGIELLNLCGFDYRLLENLSQIKAFTALVHHELKEPMRKKGLV